MMKPDSEELDLDERRLLRQGYGAMLPSGAKRDFILGALSVRLPGALAPAPSDVFSPEAPRSVPPVDRVLAAKMVAGAVVMGALGFALGSFTSRSNSTAVALATSGQPMAQVDAAASGVSELPDGVALDELDAEAVDPPRGADSMSSPDKGSPSSVDVNEVGGAPAPPAPLSFYEELSYIRRAQTALANGSPALALGLMRSLRERRPEGALLAERGVTEVLALCSLDRVGEAKTVADAVRARSDGSMYGARLEITCAPGTQPDDSGDDSAVSATSTEQTPRRTE